MPNINAYFITTNKEEAVHVFNTEFPDKIMIKVKNEYVIVDHDELKESIRDSSKEVKIPNINIMEESI